MMKQHTHCAQHEYLSIIRRIIPTSPTSTHTKGLPKSYVYIMWLHRKWNLERPCVPKCENKKIIRCMCVYEFMKHDEWVFIFFADNTYLCLKTNFTQNGQKKTYTKKIRQKQKTWWCVECVCVVCISQRSRELNIHIHTCTCMENWVNRENTYHIRAYVNLEEYECGQLVN
jgi:hypothetical protein